MKPNLISLALFVAITVLPIRLAAAESADVGTVNSNLETTRTTAETAEREFLSEIFQVNYAKVLELTDVLNKLKDSSAGTNQYIQNLIQFTGGSPPSLSHVWITPDERSNSLLAFASRSDMEKLKEFLSKLDIAMAKILIEAAVFEVPLPNSGDAEQKYSAPPVLGFTGRYPQHTAITNLTALWTTTFASGTASDASGHSHDGFTHLSRLTNDYQSMVAALFHDPHVRILQKPRILTSHRCSASIFIGRSRPYEVQNLSPYASSMSDFGLEIEVTPSIQPGGLIQLNLGLTFEKPDGATHIDGVGDVPNTFSGRSHATLIVRDGGTLIANGLIVTIKPDHPREVPIHGRVPVATGLNSSAGRKRSAIFALVTPRVLRFQKPDEPQQTASAFTFSPGKAAE